MGTAFNPGQLAELSRHASVATALPKVAIKFGDPERVLKALNGRTEVFAGHLEQALETAIARMLVLTHCKRVGLTISVPHDPSSYYKTRKGLWVYDDYQSEVVVKAKPTTGVGTKLAVDLYEITADNDATDAEIEGSLPANHLFDETTLCAVIAEMMGKQPVGEEGDLLNNGYANVFYTSSCVVCVSWFTDDAGWLVSAWLRGGFRRRRGFRVVSPAT